MSYYYSILFFLFIMHLYFKCLRLISLPFSVPLLSLYTHLCILYFLVSSMLSLPCLFVFVYVQLMCLSMLVFVFYFDSPPSHVHYVQFYFPRLIMSNLSLLCFPAVSTPIITLQCIHCITFALPAHFPILPFITFPV